MIPPFLIAQVIAQLAGHPASLREARAVSRAWYHDAEPVVWRTFKPLYLDDFLHFFRGLDLEAFAVDADRLAPSAVEAALKAATALQGSTDDSDESDDASVEEQRRAADDRAVVGVPARIVRRARVMVTIDLKRMQHWWDLDTDAVWPRLSLLFRLAVNLDNVYLPYATFSRAPFSMYRSMCLYCPRLLAFDNPLPALLVYVLRRLEAGGKLSPKSRSRQAAPPVDVRGLLLRRFPALQEFNAWGLDHLRIPNVRLVTSVTAPVAVEILRAADSTFSKIEALEVIGSLAAFDAVASAVASGTSAVIPAPSLKRLSIRMDRSNDFFNDQALDTVLAHLPNLETFLCSVRDQAVLTDTTHSLFARRCPKLTTASFTLCEASARTLVAMPKHLVHLSLTDAYVETFKAAEVPDSFWARLESFSMTFDHGDDDDDDDDDDNDGDNDATADDDVDTDARSGWPALRDLLPRLANIRRLGLPPIRIRQAASDLGDSERAAARRRRQQQQQQPPPPPAAPAAPAAPAPPPPPPPPAPAPAAAPAARLARAAAHRRKRRRHPAFRPRALALALASCPSLVWLRLLAYDTCRDTDDDAYMLSADDWSSVLALAAAAAQGSGGAGGAGGGGGQGAGGVPSRARALRVVEWDATEAWEAEKRALALVAEGLGVSFQRPAGWVWPFDVC
ncbi:hypothetical protein DFJ73DRAFT_778052 [Zopfochytrium polystomum]|nr:hypothetical protein DFJ73DRAFT_778052 [Zopfochytrium polystomum]